MYSKLRTLNLAVEFYEKASHLKLKGAMRNQYDRALLSIVLNISEGSSKPSAKERRKYYFISYGSMNEVKTLLHLAKIHQFNEDLDSLGAHLWKLAHNPGGS